MAFSKLVLSLTGLLGGQFPVTGVLGVQFASSQEEGAVPKPPGGGQEDLVLGFASGFRLPYFSLII